MVGQCGVGTYLSDVGVDCRGGTVVAAKVIVDDLTLKGARELGSLIPLALFCLSLTSCEPLLSGFARHATCTGAGTDGETFACEPGFKYTTDDLQSPGLNNTTTDWFTSANANVDDALEGERETIGGLFVE